MATATVALTRRRLTAIGGYRKSSKAGAFRFADSITSVAKTFFDTDRCSQGGECARVCPQYATRARPKAMSHG